MEQAAKLVAALCLLIPNVDGPRAHERRILMTVPHSIMLYGAEIGQMH